MDFSLVVKSIKCNILSKALRGTLRENCLAQKLSPVFPVRPEPDTKYRTYNTLHTDVKDGKRQLYITSHHTANLWPNFHRRPPPGEQIRSQNRRQTIAGHTFHPRKSHQVLWTHTCTSLRRKTALKILSFSCHDSVTVQGKWDMKKTSCLKHV